MTTSLLFTNEQHNGDETTSYDVRLQQSMTLTELIHELSTTYKHHGRFGTLIIRTEDGNKLIDETYKNHALQTIDLPKNLQSSNVNACHANGDWGRMNYIITINSQHLG